VSSNRKEWLGRYDEKNNQSVLSSSFFLFEVKWEKECVLKKDLESVCFQRPSNRVFSEASETMSSGWHANEGALSS